MSGTNIGMSRLMALIGKDSFLSANSLDGDGDVVRRLSQDLLGWIGMAVTDLWIIRWAIKGFSIFFFQQPT